MFNYSLLPEHVRGAMQRYVENRIPPGGFLTAVLENNLFEALMRADSINRERLFDIVSFLYNEVPSGCWGSPKAVKTWLKGDDHEVLPD